MAAIRYLYNRMITCQLSLENMRKENNIIQQILTSNKCDTSILRTLNAKKGQKQSDGKAQWTKFTYVGKQTRAITKIFRNTKVKVSFATDNTIGKLLAIRNQHTKNKYENCGIYQQTCPTCNMKYIGQTG